MLKKTEVQVRYVYDGVYTLPTDTIVVEPDFKTMQAIDEEYQRLDDEADGLEGGRAHVTDGKLVDYLHSVGMVAKEVWIAKAYEVDTMLIMNQKPEPIGETHKKGSDFNYGATAVIATDVPCKVLIVAQND